MKLFTKDSLKADLKSIREKGWIKTMHPGNDGGVGNTLEQLLGIEENNLPLPNAGEWEIKGQRSDSTSLITLFHMEPSPRALKFVSQIFLPQYGWPHRKAGTLYPEDEKSFRQTITVGTRTDRGFTILANYNCDRLEVSFDHSQVNISKHREWLANVKEFIGLQELNPKPYWGFNALFHKAGVKLGKTVYAIADRRRIDGEEQFRYSRFFMLEDFCKIKLINCLESGDILIGGLYT